jgi:hypothetical protein
MRWPVAVSADPLTARPEALKPSPPASEGGHGDGPRHHLWDPGTLVVERVVRIGGLGPAAAGG